MARFVFTGKSRDGERVSGTLEAKDRDSAYKNLSEKDILVTSLAKRSTRKNIFSSDEKPKASGEDLIAMTREMAALLRSGVRIKKTMDILAEDAEKPPLKHMLVEMSSAIASGASLSDQFAKYPTVFSKLYIALASAGEKAGNLPEILARLSVYLENSEALKRRVKGAFYYPATVLIFCSLVMILVMSFGIPRIAEVYANLGSQLPLPTRILIGVSNFLAHWWLVWIPLAVLLVFGLMRYAETKNGARAIDYLKLHTPHIGKMMKHLVIARFSWTFGMLYSSGVPLIETLDLVTSSVGSPIIGEVLLQALTNITHGEPIAGALRQCQGIFTNMSLSMINAGEESGELDQMLLNVANFYEAEVDAELRALSSVIEPMIMIVVGIFMALIIIALGLPFFNLVSAFHGGQ